MTHEELRDRLLDLACGELSAREAREVEDHATACEACRAELAAMRGTRRVMAALPVEPAPERGERILVAAAREAVRAKAPPRGWPRWLWAAPVVGVSLAVVIALSVRLQAPPPPSAAHEDPDALRGEPPSRFAQASPPAAPPAAVPQAETADAAGAAPAREEAPPPPAMKKGEAPRRGEGGRSRFATAPPEAPAPRPAPPLRGGAGEARADRAEAFAAAPAGAAAAPTPAPAEEAESRAQREAAPARRAKALAAPQALREAVSPRDRALAAARARAASLGLETGGALAEVGTAPLTWEAWRAQAPALAPAAAPAALAGRSFWAVTFRPPGPGGTLVVFIEDGTFRALAELRGD